MTREQVLKKYKILRHNQRAGSVYFSVKKRRWTGRWTTASEEVCCGLTDTYRDKLYWDKYEGALEWVNKDVDDRMAVYNSGVIRIDKFEPLPKENKYLKELTELLEII